MARDTHPDQHTAGEPREQAIVAAALELLTECGYERLTMDAVAARARVSKATIYRRWPGKAELVVHAMRAHVDAEPLELTEGGDLRDDLLGLLRTIRDRFSTKNRRLMIGLHNAAEHDPELAATLRAVPAANKTRMRELITRKAAAAGVIPPDAPADLDLVAEIGPSAIAVRVLVTGEPVDDGYLQQLVDEVMLPLLTRATGSADSVGQGE